MDVGEWLTALGFGRYAEAFRENRIDDAALRLVTDDDLKELGVAALGDRRKILAAAAGLDPAPGDAPEARAAIAPADYTPRHLAERIRGARAALEGERKRVTVLFADLQGSTSLIASMDPEDARRVLDGATEAMMTAVHRYEGTVNKVLGDGIMALFGAPLALEDHAARACYASLAIQREMAAQADVSRREHGVEVQARVGLHSGEVVVRAIGNDLSMDYDAIGPTVHLASRMEELAVPGSIRLTAATRRLVEGFVEVRDLGPVPVKGLSEPVEVFELTGVGAARTRLQAAARGLTRFVGRDAEMEALDRARREAAGGHGQMVALVGEPGVGKSRLFHEFTRSPAARGWLTLEASSVSYGGATPWLPVIDLLKGYFGIGDRDDKRRVSEKVAGRLVMLDEALRASLAAFLSLFDVASDDPAWRDYDAMQRRRITLNAVKGLIVRESEVQPVILMFEDLHWIDSETQTLLDELVESSPAARLLALVNYRPEYRHGWGNRACYTQLRIDPLGASGAGALLDALVGRDQGLAPLRAMLLERAEGNPLFLEESVRSLIETGALAGEPGALRPAASVAEVAIPDSVQAIIAARIDRLSAAEKSLLQAATVIGKDFPRALLAAIADMDGDGLEAALSALRAGEFVYETSLFPDAEYTFKHALTHQVAYGSLLQERRRALHARIVGELERLHADGAAEFAEVLGDHVAKGGIDDKAAAYLFLAAEKAKERFAYASAAGFAERAAEAAARMDGAPDRSMCPHTLLGDLASLSGDFEAARAHYQRALDGAADDDHRGAIADRIAVDRIATRDGARIGYTVQGAGESTLVTIAPTSYPAMAYQPVILELCHEFRCVTVWLRGSGPSDPAPPNYLTDERVEDVRAVVEALGTGPVTALGISRTGNIIVKLACKYPSLIEKLVLVSAIPDDMGPRSPFPRDRDYVARFRAAIDHEDVEAAARLLADHVISEPEARDLSEAYRRNLVEHAREALARIFDPDPERDMMPLLDEVRVPTLVAQGTEDRQVSTDCGPYIAERIRDAVFYPFVGKGHFPISTATAEFCAVLRQFVRDGTVPGPRGRG